MQTIVDPPPSKSLVRRSLALAMVAGCLHSPPYAGADDAGIGPSVDADVRCPGGISYDRAISAMVTPPACATTMTIDALGAAGGSAGAGAGGRGGHVNATISISVGDTFFITVGGAGGVANGLGGMGGVNGGGHGGSAGNYRGAGGGGATEVRTDAADLATRIIVAAGGGGATQCKPGNGPKEVSGGGGGSGMGEKSQSCSTDPASIASGGTQGAGGMGGSGECVGMSGDFGVGGDGCKGPSAGGGGGGGFYGGGGGASSGGAGGSNFVTTMSSLNVVVLMDERGINLGTGKLTLSWW